jgi:outer membrane biosynthesis protein TonB
MKTLSIPAIAVLFALGACATPSQEPRSRADALAAVQARKVGAPMLAADARCDALATRMVVAAFPAKAAFNHTEGWVELGFDLDGSGHAADIRVVAESPPATFSDAAIEALRQSQFAEGARRAGCRSVVTFALGGA